ncbi:hypothetical protein Syun_016458 [Stephania yunnanensis]|uniref:Uncharacterized protein n=1 Tax=Stephania yunnanensis TaxID=152371 RepID=A0AAP0P4X4_9MAGN
MMHTSCKRGSFPLPGGKTTTLHVRRADLLQELEMIPDEKLTKQDRSRIIKERCDAIEAHNSENIATISTVSLKWEVAA